MDFHRARHIHAFAKHEREVFALGIILALLQAMDALLTAVGISTFGVHAEGNQLLQGLMLQFGHIPVLALTKSIALLVIATLLLLSRHVKWIRTALWCVSFIYLFAAILPWTYILTSASV